MCERALAGGFSGMKYLRSVHLGCHSEWQWNQPFKEEDREGMSVSGSFRTFASGDLDPETQAFGYLDAT
jgi:hypothetical protein